MNADEGVKDRCKGCGKIIDEEEYVTHFENRGVGISEEILMGYQCVCGHKEDF